MATKRTSDEKPKTTRRPPATTPEARENQLISLAVDLAEKQIREGTASSQVISHYLKLGTVREKLEQEKLAHETQLLSKKTEAMESAKKVEELYMEALNAMRSYAGHTTGDEDLDEYDD